MVALEGGPTAYSLACDAVTVALTMVALSPLAGRLLNTAGVPLGLTVADASMRKGLVVAANPPTATITPAAATLTYTPSVGFVLACEAVSLTVTPAAAGLIATRVIETDPVSVVVTSNPTDLRAARLVETDPLVLTIAASASNLERGFTMAAAPIAVIVGIPAANLIYEPAGAFSLAADAASLLITPADASLRRGVLLATAPVSLSVAIRDAALVTGALAPALARDVATITLPRVDRGTVTLTRFVSSGVAPDGQSITRTYTWASSTFTFADALHTFTMHRSLGG
jgi:hypothetical protein